MKSEKLIEFIRHPERISADDLRELDDLVNRYPYFQTARILYLKALYMQAGARFRNELRVSTVHISDHKQFFRYLNQQITFDCNTPEAINSGLSDIVDERLREINGHIEVTSQGIPAYPQQQPAIGREKEIASFNLRQNDKIQPAKPEEKAHQTNANVVSNPILLEDMPGVINDYNEEKNTAAVHEEIKQTPVFRQPEPKESNKLPDLSGIPGMVVEEQPQGSVLIMSVDLDDEDENESTSPQINPVSQSQSSFESSEILSGSYLLKEKETVVPQKEQSKEQPKHTKRKKKDELIDQFIQLDPGMPKINATVTDNRDLSKENPLAGEELFSETLAKIYVRQHLYEKAIATYIKLSLKYPEKSVYFAHRIEKIKENINNQE